MIKKWRPETVFLAFTDQSQKFGRIITGRTLKFEQKEKEEEYFKFRIQIGKVYINWLYQDP